MFPRSATTCERMSVPRSMTLAMFSSPWVILMLSTTVSIAGNVDRIFSTGTPISNGVYRFGSNVSGRRHAAGHPEEDAGVGGRLRVLEPGRRPRSRGRRRRRSPARRRSWPGRSRGGRGRGRRCLTWEGSGEAVVKRFRSVAGAAATRDWVIRPGELALRPAAIIFHVPDFRVRPAGDVGDELSDPPVRVAAAQLGEGSEHVIAFRLGHGSVSRTWGSRVTSSFGKVAITSAEINSPGRSLAARVRPRYPVVQSQVARPDLEPLQRAAYR